MLSLGLGLICCTGCVTVTARPLARPGVELHHHLTSEPRPVHWVEAGDPGLPTVVFVHGTPGAWSAFRDFLTSERLLAVAHLVAVDRPGFGSSGRGEALVSLAEQAAALAPVLELDRDRGRPILVGHSLGAPIVARLAMDRPDLVGGLVLVSPSIDPALERLTWYQRLGRRWPWRRLLPLDLATALRELVPLRAELEAMREGWSELQVPVILIQGDRDRLVDPRNAAFAERVVPGRLSVVRAAGVGHLIPWKAPELIVDAVVAMVGALEDGP